MERRLENSGQVSAEKKLQLIRQIRKEHQMNQNMVRGREAFLYGNKEYIPFNEVPEVKEKAEDKISISTFRLRLSAALLLFGIFYSFVSQNKDIFGVSVSEVYAMIETDYSPILFDFMEEIPYTLHE